MHTHSVRLLVLWACCCGLPTTHAESVPAPTAPLRHPAAPADVAREILRLQQQLGGSLVDQSPELRQAGPATTRPAALDTPTAPSPAATDIEVLRESAWRLDTTAHHLELRNLYAQADALRALAEKLRQDARARQTKSRQSP